MHKLTQVSVTENAIELYIASSNSEFRDMHLDDAKSMIFAKFQEIAERIEQPVAIDMETTRSGITVVKYRLLRSDLRHLQHQIEAERMAWLG